MINPLRVCGLPGNNFDFMVNSIASVIDKVNEIVVKVNEIENRLEGLKDDDTRYIE